MEVEKMEVRNIEGKERAVCGGTGSSTIYSVELFIEMKGIHKLQQPM